MYIAIEGIYHSFYSVSGIVTVCSSHDCAFAVCIDVAGKGLFLENTIFIRDRYIAVSN